MIEVKTNLSFPGWFEVMHNGQMIKEVQGYRKALRIAKDIAKKFKVRYVLSKGEIIDLKSQEPVSTDTQVSEQASESDAQKTTVGEQVAPDESIEPDQETSDRPPDELYLGMNGKTCGPFSPDKTMELLLSGEVGKDNLAWKRGMDEWQPLKEVWPNCVNLASTSGTDETDPPPDLSERMRNELRKDCTPVA